MTNINDVFGFKYHYLHKPEPGFTVSYGDKAFRIHDDGKGWLHIIIQEKGSRKKIGLDRLRETTFEYGSRFAALCLFAPCTMLQFTTNIDGANSTKPLL